MPGRKYEAQSGYKYGFNGKEKDKDLNSLTAYDYGFRIYNPGIGKFLSVDPLTSKFPFYSPYHFAGNMPIKCIDLEGGEPLDRVENWQGKQMIINETRKVNNEVEYDPAIGVYSYSAVYDRITKQYWFVMHNKDGSYSYWKHNEGADPTSLLQSSTGKYNNGHWEIFETANARDARIGAESSELIGKVFYGAFVAIAGGIAIEGALSTYGTEAAVDFVIEEVKDEVKDQIVNAIETETGVPLSLLPPKKPKGLGNPFKDKNLSEVEEAMEKQVKRGKMIPKPSAPGAKVYQNKKSGYSYNLDPGGKYGKKIEEPHIDVNYPKPKPKDRPKKKLEVNGGFQ